MRHNQPPFTSQPFPSASRKSGEGLLKLLHYPVSRWPCCRRKELLPSTCPSAPPLAQALGSNGPRGCHWQNLQEGLWAVAQVPVAFPKWAVWPSHTGPQFLALSAGDRVPPPGSPGCTHFPFQAPSSEHSCPIGSCVFEPNDQGPVVSPLPKTPKPPFPQRQSTISPKKSFGALSPHL